MSKRPIKIEFFHDVICSFCFPMSYRMRQLKAAFPEIEIIHRSFALVRDESDFVRMFGSRKNAKAEIMSHWASANRNDDLHRFNIEGMRQQNFLFPMSMHPLWAAKAAYYVGGEEAYWDLFDALQFSFFSQNKNIELEEVIFENVVEAGIDLAKWKKYYLSDTVKEAVEADLQLAQKYGLHSVPSLVINQERIVSGAVSLDQLKKVVSAVAELTEIDFSSDAACENDGSK